MEIGAQLRVPRLHARLLFFSPFSKSLEFGFGRYLQDFRPWPGVFARSAGDVFFPNPLSMRSDAPYLSFDVALAVLVVLSTVLVSATDHAVLCRIPTFSYRRLEVESRFHRKAQEF